jgi:hypothetical protein
MSIDLVALLAGMAELMSLPDWLLAPPSRKLHRRATLARLRIRIWRMVNSIRRDKTLLLKDDGGWEGTYNLAVQSSRPVWNRRSFSGKLTAPVWSACDYSINQPHLDP